MALLRKKQHGRARTSAARSWDQLSTGSQIGDPSLGDRGISSLLDYQPSGVSRAFRYWYGFTPTSSFEDSAAPDFLCGSGSDSALSILICIDDEPEFFHDTGSLPSMDEIIATIRGSLSLQVKELAEILRVQRPTVYSWIKDEVEPSASNRDRLQQLYRIALRWKSFCRLPAERLIRWVGADGHSALDLLRGDNIDEVEVGRRFEKLARQRLKMKRDADLKRPTSGNIAQQLGLAADDVSDQQYLIDAATGKRSNLD